MSQHPLRSPARVRPPLAQAQFGRLILYQHLLLDICPVPLPRHLQCHWQSLVPFPRPSDCACLRIQQGFHEGPACSIQNNCFSKSVAYSWMVTIPHRTVMKIGHLHVCNGTFRQTWKESGIAQNTEARYPKWLARDDIVNGT